MAWGRVGTTRPPLTTHPSTGTRTRGASDVRSEEEPHEWAAKDGGTRRGKRRDGIAQERWCRRHHPKDHRQAHAGSQLFRCHGRSVDGSPSTAAMEREGFGRKPAIHRFLRRSQELGCGRVRRQRFPRLPTLHRCVEGKSRRKDPRSVEILHQDHPSGILRPRNLGSERRCHPEGKKAGKRIVEALGTRFRRRTARCERTGEKRGEKIGIRRQPLQTEYVGGRFARRRLCRVH
mmetsp:Transcript_4134/g.26114  ORF Transcript_4134/g.26114 Transcript_4134/m.26114 type:complete len:233 (+) Transcript_4134:1-699(+)